MDDKYDYSYLDDKGIYCYRGTTVLINKFGIKDDDEFRRAERFYSGLRQTELHNNPLPGNFDFSHLKAIHHYLFQDLFYWAGKPRTVAIAKLNLFCLPQHIDSYAEEVFSKLAKSGFLVGYSREAFVDSLADFLGDLNALHPFREGNGRTQREFIRCVAMKSGYGLDWSLVTPEENIVASYESVNGNNKKLRNLLSRIVFKLS